MMFGYRFPDDLCWVNDKGRIVVINEKTNISFELNGAEGILWRLLQQEMSFSQAVVLFSDILSVPQSEGEAKTGIILKTWFESGLLEKQNG
ncbi:MAG: hypothetical protein AB9907_02355 [Flexilinea sp.]